MLSAGLDIGSLWSKAVVLDGTRVVGSHIAKTGDDSAAAAETVLGGALRAAGLRRDDIRSLAVTGAGKKAVPAVRQVVDVVCCARGIKLLHPEADGVVDMGAESTRAVRVDDRGGVVEFGLNDKCAAGTGVFLDAIAGVMGVPVEQMGPLSLTSSAEVNITSMCVVYAESEVVSQVHRQTPKADILRGLHKSIATRVHSLMGRVGVGERCMAVGGLALNSGIVAWLGQMTGGRVAVAESPQTVAAIGAALVAAEEVQ